MVTTVNTFKMHTAYGIAMCLRNEIGFSGDIDDLKSISLHDFIDSIRRCERGITITSCDEERETYCIVMNSFMSDDNTRVVKFIKLRENLEEVMMIKVLLPY